MPEQLADREYALLSELSDLAKLHADKDSNLVLLPIDPETYPAQRTFHVEGDPQHAAVVDNIALTVEPRFPELQAKLQEREERQGEVSRIAELLKGGNNVVLVTNHGELIDIALAFAALYGALDKTNPSHDFKTGIMISKIISMLGYKIGEEAAPAAEVLKIGCNDIFLSYPRTESVRKSGLSKIIPDEIDKHNRRLRGQLENRLKEGGFLLAMAASGTTDKPTEDNPDVIGLGTLSQGTIKILKSQNTYVLPVAIWLKDTEPMFEICDIPRIVTSDAQAHKMMGKIAEVLTENVEDKKFVYKNPGSIGGTAIKGS